MQYYQVFYSSVYRLIETRVVFEFHNYYNLPFKCWGLIETRVVFEYQSQSNFYKIHLGLIETRVVFE